jgi:hypothetical protein
MQQKAAVIRFLMRGLDIERAAACKASSIELFFAQKLQHHRCGGVGNFKAEH